ncbi:cytochrome P450 [Streptomyces cocklensis]|uniref:Cytochrome P450 123 n=1 Tax=Actinacidiphila cocklensis TaxID=887465 RepID=A0A9W4GRR1_9ACTN|nr:cytochrome P450 [Actinacidiphila cocklensis]MDD1057242.1 cytochrome P450 [Actinacidiphila cocklensis]WSX78402.1 cytochrome P450 [Streptomyces sp. NBC_00899]CAG6395002.1 Putative cytochrome P450 123 [Actinacidiphila cocklensis]
MAVEYSPYDVQLNVDPYPLYARLREEAPVYHNADLDIWVLSRHADVDAALRDPAGYSSSNGPVLDDAIWGPDAHKMMSFSAMDAPDHTRTRALVSSVFNPRRVAAMEPHIREIVRTHLEAALERESFDFIADVAATVPMDVISELIGVPADDRAEARRLINLAFHRPPGARDMTPENAQAMGELAGLFVRWVAERRSTPAEDLLTTLAQAEVDGSPLTDPEIISLLGLLVTAGYETSLRLLGNAWYWAWRNPEQLARAFDGGISEWIEETLRYDAPVQYVLRTLTEERTIHGVRVPAGARVLLLIASANRDSEVFADAESYDLDRANTHRAISFGGGPHFCIGAPLARLEGRIVLDELASLISGYQIDAERSIRVYTTNIRGFASLPTTLKLR